MVNSDRARVGLLSGTGALVVAVLVMGVSIPVPGMEDGRPWALAFVGFPIASVLLLWRRPRNVIGRLLGLVGLSAGGIFFLSWSAVTFADHPASSVAEALTTGSLGSVLICAVVAILLLFPTGRPLPGMERTFSAFLTLAGALTVVSSTRAGPMPVTGRHNPIGIGGTAWGVTLLRFVPLVFLVLAVWTLVQRHRRGGPLERVQLKWLFSSALLVLAAVTAAHMTPPDASPAALITFAIVLVAGFWSVPAAIVVAVSRYRLFEIDRLWSRTASYGIVAAVLVGVYAASVLGLQAILPGGSDVAVAASTLAVAALFSPLRLHVRSAVDRWFDRSRFEADRVISEFAAGLRHELDLETLSAALTDTCVRTMRPSSVHLWLAPRPGQTSRTPAALPGLHRRDER